MDRGSIKERARFVLRRNRWLSVGMLVAYALLSSVVGAMTWGLGVLLLMPPLTVGFLAYWLAIWRGEVVGFEKLFSGFSRYVQSLVAILWMYLWTFLWSLLFVIPGIIKALQYFATPYLVADYPDLNPREALKLSIRITQGHLMEIFIMNLSFFGWYFLSAFTAGILAFVHVTPYHQISMAGLYESLLADALERGVVTEAELMA
ncbi:MAG: DUF975 family protein [Oscillospiraceae bacterium]|jgi:uncharacterized membrane protein|nr:DUF975 family protein [Oscillospiraceae bacterium]